jgi:hypothetical protein
LALRTMSAALVFLISNRCTITAGHEEMLRLRRDEAVFRVSQECRL